MMPHSNFFNPLSAQTGNTGFLSQTRSQATNPPTAGQEGQPGGAQQQLSGDPVDTVHLQGAGALIDTNGLLGPDWSKPSALPLSMASPNGPGPFGPGQQQF